MVLSDFLSRQHRHDSNPHEIMPISFNMGKILKQNYQNYTRDTPLVQTRSQSKTKNAKYLMYTVVQDLHRKQGKRHNP